VSPMASKQAQNMCEQSQILLPKISSRTATVKSSKWQGFLTDLSQSHR
jgi:hypothetical protein